MLEGFLPRTASTEMPHGARRIGLQEMGLPYAADAAITRHLAKFLRQQEGQGKSGMACPTHVLFNGGVMHAQFVRDRLLEVLNSWLKQEGAAPVQPLSGEDLMHSVARGAAYYGAARHGHGVRIRGGIARSYYVGIESAMPAVPGFQRPQSACRSRNSAWKKEPSARIPDREFGLIVGQARRVPFLLFRRRARTMRRER